MFKCRKAFRVFSATQLRSVPKLPGAATCQGTPWGQSTQCLFSLGPHMCNFKKLSRQLQPRLPAWHFPSGSQKVFSFSCTSRKKCLLCNNVLMIVAASIMGCSKISHSFEMILIGRFMCGLSAGEWLLPQLSRISQNFTSLFKVNNKSLLRKQNIEVSDLL